MRVEDKNLWQSVFGNDYKTFYELSFNHAQNTYCLNRIEEALIEAFDFDAIQAQWYDFEAREKAKFNCPCSVDALYPQDGFLFLFEFKSGKLDGININRKIYDTIIALVEKAKKTLDFCRSNVCCFVVAASQEEAQKNIAGYDEVLLNRVEGYMSAQTELLDSLEDFRCTVKSPCQLSKLEDVIIKRAYCVAPNHWSDLVKRMKLSN